MKIISWNVNGVRSVAKKGELSKLFDSYDPEVVFLMETKANHDQLDSSITDMPGYDFVLNPSQARSGHSGCALYVKKESEHSIVGFDELLIPYTKKMKHWYSNESFKIRTREGVSDRIVPNTDYTVLMEGRLITLKLKQCIIIGCYFPNGGDRIGMDGLHHKLCFYDCFTQYMVALQKKYPNIPVIVMGDVNITLSDSDLARPESNKFSVGCIPLDRKNLQIWQSLGWVDVFRHTNPDTVVYSWWDVITGARARNVGWRIDSVWARNTFLERIQIEYLVNYMGSDHCPLLINYNPIV